MNKGYNPLPIFAGRRLGILFFLLISVSMVYGQTTIVRWPFGVTGTTPNPSFGDPNAGGTNAIYTNAGSTTSLTTGSGGRYFATQWNDATLNLNRYLEIAFTPNANYNLTVQQLIINLDRNAAGPPNYEVRISDTGFSSFTSVATGAVPSAATSFTLPVSSGIVRETGTTVIRIYFWGASTTAGQVSVGNIAVLGTVQRPTITATPSTLTNFSTTQGVPSAAQSYVVSGSALVSDLTTTAPAGYEVSLSPGGSFSSSLILPQTVGSVAATTIYVRLKGTTTGSVSGSIANASTSAISSNNPFLSGTVSAALPVTLISFKGQAAGSAVVLTWSTAQEQNSERFAVQRSSDASEFVSIGTRQTAGTTDRQQYYSLTDEAPRNGLNYYRLQQVDRDGSVVYSKPLAVRVDASLPYASLLENPTDGQTIQLKLYQMDAPQVRLNAFDGQAIAGQLTRSGITEAVFIPTSPLSPGLYVLTVQEGATRQAMKVLVK